MENLFEDGKRIDSKNPIYAVEFLLLIKFVNT